MTKQIILTSEGLKKYEQELEFLKTEKRKEIAEKIKTALFFGDLSENSEYDEAKNEQAAVEARIHELEQMLKNVKIIDDDDINTETVVIGSKVRVLDLEYNEEFSYRVVGSAEANPKRGLISDESPVGKALLGHAVGDQVIVEAPAGEISLKILDISR